MHKVIKNCIPKDRINKHIKEYSESKIRHPGSMNTADPGKYKNAYDELVSKHIGIDLTCVSGNYYKHNLPYMPHTDYKSHLGNSVNIVIPLSYDGIQPRFIIFDQKWTYESITWSMHLPVKQFAPFCGVNTAVKGSMHEYDVLNLTNKPINKKLYNDHLYHLNEEDLFGMSGHVTYFNPGDIILFDNQNIHCTSMFDGSKLGLSLRYTRVRK